MNMEQADYRDFLGGLDAGSVDLVLTDPPYCISSEVGFSNKGDKRFHSNKQDFGDWDKEEIDLDALAQGAWKCLRKGGTMICFYDFWKLSHLAASMRAAGFGILRSLYWDKVNPVPVHSNHCYLNNAREFALCAAKGSNPTFHSSYDRGCYQMPIPRFAGGRLHPTQKPVELFRQLVEKHSNPDDLVVDPFLGSGTTAEVAASTGRRFAGCDISSYYVAVARARVKGGELL